MLGTIGRHDARRFYEEVVTKSCETVRRKVRWLIDRDPVVRVGRNELTVHPDIGSRFCEFDASPCRCRGTHPPTDLQKTRDHGHG